MSQAIQRGIILLTVLLVAAIGVAGFALYQKKLSDDKNINLQENINDLKIQQDKLIAESKKLQQEKTTLQSNVAQKEKEKAQIQAAYDELKRKEEELSSQVTQANEERDDWKGRVDTLRKERDELMTKLQNQPAKIVYKDRPAEASSSSSLENEAKSNTPKTDEYWAGILTLKARLQVDLDKAKADLDSAALQVADLKKQNSELQLQIKSLNTEKLEIDRRLSGEKTMQKSSMEKQIQDLYRKLKDNEYLVNNLSMEAARARSDQKTANEYASKVKEDNGQLQSQVRQLVSNKVALEKTITRLSQEKDEMNKKLSETEGVIQDRINEIWQIKNTLDQKISQINEVKSNNKEVELPPIVVSASNAPNQAGTLEGHPHKIISINEKNNFVVTDLGESQGAAIGKILKVYRDNLEMATLEVIQVRRDISAADIRDLKGKIQIGDQIR